MKPKPLLALNHFTVPCSLLTALLFSVSRRAAEHYIELSDAPVPSPSTEPRPSSSFVRETAKQCTEQKNGRKCDLATALLPKGDTRATNAKPENHGKGYSEREIFIPLRSISERKGWPNASPKDLVSI